ncbi:MAG: hypothetical protein JWM31_3127 [Solirubrobacterales bacterium]|nr:hypothetical protein [Solirubrobacterales bacterium]
MAPPYCGGASPTACFALVCSALIASGGVLATATSATAASSCQHGGVTNRSAQGVRLYTIKSLVKGKARVRLLACPKGAKIGKTLAYGPPGLVSFGAFHSSGRHVGFEVTGVQSAAGRAGAGTNYNIGWVDARTGQVRMNFWFVHPIRPPHRYAIDAKSGALALLIGTLGKPETLLVASYDSATNDFAGSDEHQLDGDWNSVYVASHTGTLQPTSIRFVDGHLSYTTADGTALVDPATGDPVPAALRGARKAPITARAVG